MSEILVVKLGGTTIAEQSHVLADVTAVASGRGGSIMIAGHDRNGLSGMVVARLLADGHLDMLFGRNGTSSVDLDLDFDFATTTTINKMLVLEDGGVVLAGGYAGGTQPFAAKLLGDAGGDSPGVLAFSNVYTDAAEQDGQAGGVASMSTVVLLIVSMFPALSAEK